MKKCGFSTNGVVALVNNRFATSARLAEFGQIERSVISFISPFKGGGETPFVAEGLSGVRRSAGRILVSLCEPKVRRSQTKRFHSPG